jgi:Asp-tRNA(Asn)/Glu-tRNA(Gln) amidotransferase A subunit family amidase
VARIKAAGAIVMAKANLAEWAFTPYETVSSIRPGYTKNPYALDRVTAGSSGGTAAAVAASLGAVGLGSDTGNSIRGPSSHQALVGIRSTMGLTSRAGVFPLNLLADIAGPMARTVTDAAAVFQVVAGEDADDPATAAARGRAIPRYAEALDAAALRSSRIGVLRQAYERDTTDPEIVQVFLRAVDDLRRAGATIVDPATIDGLDGIQRVPGIAPCQGFKHDLNAFLAARAGRVPVADLAAVVKGGKFHPSTQRRLEQAEQGPANGPGTPECAAAAATDWRSQHAARRQQPVLLADHGISVRAGADGVHTRRPAAGRPHALRPPVDRGPPHRAGLRLRAGDAPSPAAADHAAAALSGGHDRAATAISASLSRPVTRCLRSSASTASLTRPRASCVNAS